MNFIDWAVATVSPERGVRRAQARAHLRAYAAAQSGRRPTGFNNQRGSANVHIGESLRALRDRSSQMVRDTAHGSAIVDALVRNIIGTGFTPVWQTGSDRLDRQVTSLWEEWSQASDVEGELGFGAQQAIAVRCMIERGDSLMRWIDLRYGEGRVPMRVQLLEGDHIDASRDTVVDGRRCRLGVALGEYNRRLGYYCFADHPGEAISTASSVFIPRSEMRHVYRPLRIGQVRGVPWLAPILLPASDLANLFQYTIVREQTAASFVGYLTNTQGMPSPLATTTAASGERTMMPEPGTLYELKQGQDIKFPDLPGGGQFEVIAMRSLQAMAIGAGLTYDQVTGDLRQANYSSMRAGKIEHWRFIDQVTDHHIIPCVCNAPADRFIDRAILAGALKPRAEGYPRLWVPPPREPINPKDDLEADIMAVRSGRMTPQEFIAQWGRDWRKVVDDTSEFWAAVDEKNNVMLDIDGRRPRAGAPAQNNTDDAADDTDAADAGGDKPKPKKRKPKEPTNG